MTTHGLDQKTIVAIKSILKKNSKIKKILLYGSRAKGTYKNGSDIDLTLIAPELTTSDLLQIETELEELMLPYKIDLSLFHQIENNDVVEHIQRVGVKF